MRMRFALGLAEAEAAIKAGHEEARRQGWLVTVAVVDDSGAVIQLSRMDEATPASVDAAIGKARSAALTGVDTKILEAMVKDRPALTTMDRIAIEGGLPVLHQRQRVGGIGVSGVQSHQDAQVASAAFAALTGAIAAA
jgi:glc operon protein GlcG